MPQLDIVSFSSTVFFLFIFFWFFFFKFKKVVLPNLFLILNLRSFYLFSFKQLHVLLSFLFSPFKNSSIKNFNTFVFLNPFNFFNFYMDFFIEKLVDITFEIYYRILDNFYTTCFVFFLNHPSVFNWFDLSDFFILNTSYDFLEIAE